MKINKQKKGTNYTKPIYEDQNVISVNIPNNEMLMEIVGSFDSNIKELEKISGSKIFFRGNSITIKGNKNTNEKVKNAIEYLIDRFRSDNKIDRNDIIASLNKDMVKNINNQSIIQPIDPLLLGWLQRGQQFLRNSA